jgi:uncharacterized damage-inducible protein DinB
MVMIADVIRTMYAYNAWANGRVLDAAERLRPEERRADGGASFSSIHDTLVHIMGAQWIYLARWTGTSPSAMPAADAFSDLAAIRERWARIEADTQQFVAALSDAALARVVDYLNTEGVRWAYPLWQQMLHQVNHATQHRSEAAMLLTRFGQSPGRLDFLYYLDLNAAER